MNEKENYLSSNLKYLRITYNKTLNDICKVVDKSQVAVHYWEEGTREPNAIDIAKLANFYNVPIDDLLLKDLRFANSDIEKQLQDKILDNVKLCTEDEKKQILQIIEVIRKSK